MQLSAIDPSFRKAMSAFGMWARKKLNITAHFIKNGEKIEFGAKGLTGYSVNDILGSDSMKIVRPGASKKVSPDKAMAKVTGWTYAAIKAIADEISCIEFRLFEIKDDGAHQEFNGRKNQERTEHIHDPVKAG